VYGSQIGQERFPSVVHRMLEEGGVKSFWRGNAINVVKVVPEMALKFMIYEQVFNFQDHEVTLYLLMLS
jgi:hypothetical protein